jgi:hypothetical protein
MFRTETESAITDTANFGGNRPPYESHYGDNQGTIALFITATAVPFCAEERPAPTKSSPVLLRRRRSWLQPV